MSDPNKGVVPIISNSSISLISISEYPRISFNMYSLCSPNEGAGLCIISSELFWNLITGPDRGYMPVLGSSMI